MSTPTLRSRSYRVKGEGVVEGETPGGAGHSDPASAPPDDADRLRDSNKDPSAPGFIEWALYYLIPGLFSLGLRWIYLANKAVSAAISTSGTMDNSFLLRWMVHPLAAVFAVLSPRKAPKGLPHVDAMGELDP
jgi:hypothetical protein